jgi:hypothetical protein
VVLCILKGNTSKICLSEYIAIRLLAHTLAHMYPHTFVCLYVCAHFAYAEANASTKTCTCMHGKMLGSKATESVEKAPEREAVQPQFSCRRSHDVLSHMHECTCMKVYNRDQHINVTRICRYVSVHKDADNTKPTTMS